MLLTKFIRTLQAFGIRNALVQINRDMPSALNAWRQEDL